MPIALRIVLAIATLLTTLFLLGLGVYGLVTGSIGLAITCLFMGAGFGYFDYIDYRFFFMKKTVATTPPPKE
jgi:hypothetical protein